MPEISELYYVNAAAAVNRIVSGSDALKATTLCVAEMDDGTVVVAHATTPEAGEEQDRQDAARAALDARLNPPRRGKKSAITEPAPATDP